MTAIYVNKDRFRAALPGREDFDFYPTPYNVAESALKCLETDIKPQHILDPGAGTGVWGNAARKLWPESIIMGIDVRPIEKPAQYDFWFNQDFLLTDEIELCNLIIGNPPYKHAEQFIRHGMGILEPNGHLIFLLRLNFLEGVARKKGLWRIHPPKQVVVLSNRISFTGDGKTNATAYAIYIWQKNWIGETILKWM